MKESTELFKTIVYVQLFLQIMAFEITVATSIMEKNPFLLIPDLISISVFIIILQQYSRVKNRNIPAYIEGNGLVKISRDLFPGIWHFGESLMKQMSISSLTLQLYLVKTKSLEAHIVVDNQNIYLVLSRGMLSHTGKSPKDLETILAHEFGHVLQGDNKEFLANKLLVQVFGIISILDIIFRLALILFTHDSDSYVVVMLQSIIFIAVDLFMVATYWKIIRKRRQAEHLADLASFIYASPSNIRSFLYKHTPDKGSTSYPSKKQRLMYIEKTIKLFRISCT